MIALLLSGKLAMFASIASLKIGLPITAGLAAVALVGYLFGTRTRTQANKASDQRRQQEFDRAARIAKQLETIVANLRQDLVAHHSQLATFKRQLKHAQEEGHERAWEHLCGKAESMLGPTMQLAQQLSHAYDQIRQQSDALETFSHGRIDPLTGVGNGRALEQHLSILLSNTSRGNSIFSIGLFSLAGGANECEARDVASNVLLLPKLATLISSCLRECDFVARYGDDEFVVLMPQTPLSGARVFANRVRKRVVVELTASVCCGLAEVQAGDDARALLARADSALYSAKAAGHNRLFVHMSGQIREDQPPPLVKAVPSECEAAILTA